MNHPHQGIPEIDTLVVGGGIVGTTLGGFLAEEGTDVAVVDAGYAGGTAANAGSLHVQMQSVLLRRFPERVPQVEKALHLYKLGVAYWQAFQEELGADCEVKVSGGLMIAENQQQMDVLVRKAKRESELGLEVAILDRAEVEKIAPYLGPSVIGAEFCVHEGKVESAPRQCRDTALGAREGGGADMERARASAGESEPRLSRDDRKRRHQVWPCRARGRLWQQAACRAVRL